MSIAEAPVKTISLTIDGKAVSVPEGTTIWQAAKETGVDVPVLCHDERMSPVGVCRMCVVDVGGRVLTASCVRTCEDGMEVHTASEKVQEHRKMLTRLLVADHPSPCAKEQTTNKSKENEIARGSGATDHHPSSGREVFSLV